MVSELAFYFKVISTESLNIVTLGAFAAKVKRNLFMPIVCSGREVIREEAEKKIVQKELIYTASYRE